jgi:hypothetical protein
MYLGALHAFASNANPDHLAQCAQSARELMEKLPRRVGAEQPSRGSLTEQVRELQTVWGRYRAQTDKPVRELLEEKIDRPLLLVLVKVEELIAWTERSAPGRRTEARIAIREIDISGIDLPDHLLEQNVTEWLRLREFFDKTAHHRGNVSAEDVERELQALESFLSDRLVPEATDDLQTIDRIVRGGSA